MFSLNPKTFLEDKANMTAKLCNLWNNIIGFEYFVEFDNTCDAIGDCLTDAMMGKKVNVLK